MDIKSLLEKDKSYAIIGASNSPEKYGYKIFKQMKDLGYEVYPINPREELIQGETAYENLHQLPKKVDVLNFVVPPKVSAGVTKTGMELGYKVFWYQPGSYDQSVIDLHDGRDTEVINDRCLLIESRQES